MSLTIKYLMNNQTAYNEYFEWKKHFKVFDKIDSSLKNSMCQLCAALNVENPKKKIHHDINHWWRDLGHYKIKGIDPTCNHILFTSDKMLEKVNKEIFIFPELLLKPHFKGESN